jgi:hypothetical protein
MLSRLIGPLLLAIALVQPSSAFQRTVLYEHFTSVW